MQHSLKSRQGNPDAKAAEGEASQCRNYPNRLAREKGYKEWWFCRRCPSQGQEYAPPYRRTTWPTASTQICPWCGSARLGRAHSPANEMTGSANRSAGQRPRSVEALLGGVPIPIWPRSRVPTAGVDTAPSRAGSLGRCGCCWLASRRSSLSLSLVCGLSPRLRSTVFHIPLLLLPAHIFPLRRFPRPPRPGALPPSFALVPFTSPLHSPPFSLLSLIPLWLPFPLIFLELSSSLFFTPLLTSFSCTTYIV